MDTFTDFWMWESTAKGITRAESMFFFVSEVHSKHDVGPTKVQHDVGPTKVQHDVGPTMVQHDVGPTMV